MKSFDELLRGYDIDYFGNGKHKISFDKAVQLQKKEEAIIIDVRTKEEVNYIQFSFSKNIPLNEIPDRLSEIPEDKAIILFCVSSTRSSIALSYLHLRGYKNVKIIAKGISEITDYIKPGYVIKNS